jgi:hypothetical protein
MAMEGGVFWIPTQSFRDLFPIPAVALSSNSKLQQNQDTNNLKINKMKNITKSIIALFAVVVCLAA